MKESKSHRNLRALCEGAVMVALAQLLGYLKLFSLPSGGSITLNMLPIFFYCCRWGFGRGMLASSAFALLQLVGDRALFVGWQSIFGDYLLAYGLLGVAGLFWRKKNGFFIGTAVGTLARFLVAWSVGATLWAEYMPDRFFGMTMTSPWFYSALYNGSYLLPCMALCLLCGLLLRRVLARWFAPQLPE